MKNHDSLLLEFFGIKAAANGKFAIAATLIVLLLAGAGFAVGRSLNMW